MMIKYYKIVLISVAESHNVATDAANFLEILLVKMVFNNIQAIEMNL